jgi:hypothetical protein
VRVVAVDTYDRCVEPGIDGTEGVRRHRVWPWLTTILLVLGVCCVVPGAGVALWRYAHRCVLTPDEAALVAAYSSDPMIRQAKEAASAGPIRLDGPCDYETGRLDGHVVVLVDRPVDTWRTSEQLAEANQAASAAAGWVPASPDPDLGPPKHPAVHYCRRINGVHSSLTILIFRLETGPQIFEQRYISSEPRFLIGAACS